MKRNDYYKLADLLSEFKKEFKEPQKPPLTREMYEEIIKYNAITSAIHMVKELAEYMGDECK